MTEKVLTFRQYVDAKHRAIANEYDITITHSRSVMHPTQDQREWREHVVATFDAGGHIDTRLWRSLDEGLRYQVLRTNRALRDNDLTKRMVIAALKEKQRD